MRARDAERDPLRAGAQQGKAFGGKEQIIEHPDVRRMLCR